MKPRSQARLGDYKDPVVEYPESETDSSHVISIVTMIERLRRGQPVETRTNLVYLVGEDTSLDDAISQMPEIFKEGADLLDLKRSAERAKEVIDEQIARRKKLAAKKTQEKLSSAKRFVPHEWAKFEELERKALEKRLAEEKAKLMSTDPDGVRVGAPGAAAPGQ